MVTETENTWQILQSVEDLSRNFVLPKSDGGFLEARYVRRTPEYFIVYLSSQTGCNQSCRFCHLTATGQTQFTQVTPEEFLTQADQVLAYYDSIRDSQGPAQRVNFNWMARGEPLANPHLLAHAREIIEALGDRAARRGLDAHFNISSILPRSLAGQRLSTWFQGLPVTFYYSLYSLDPAFRKRWLPKALPANEGLDMLVAWQADGGPEIVIHGALIAGENDADADLDALAAAVTARGLNSRVNLVRYNPYSERQGQETAEDLLDAKFQRLAGPLGNPNSRIVPRVGFDVKASCGMFVVVDQT